MGAATMGRKANRTIKTNYVHVCRFDGDTLVKVARYEKFVWAYRRKQRTPGAFLVNECVAIDPDASDLGTIYWFDERGNDMDRYF